MSQTVKRPWLKKMLLSFVGKPLVKEFEHASKNLEDQPTVAVYLSS